MYTISMSHVVESRTLSSENSTTCSSLAGNEIQGIALHKAGRTLRESYDRIVEAILWYTATRLPRSVTNDDSVSKSERWRCTRRQI